MPKAQLKNPRRIFSYVDDIITVLASIRKLLNSFGTDKLNIPKKYTIFQMKKIRQIKQVHNSVAKLTPPPPNCFCSLLCMTFYGGREKNTKKNYIITKTIVFCQVIFLFQFWASQFLFVSFIFVEFFLFHSSPALDFLSNIESAFLEKKCYEKVFIFEFSFFSLLCPFFLVGSRNTLNFPYCSISLISVVCFSVIFSSQKILFFDFSLNFQYLQRYTKKEQASGLVAFLI